MFCFQGLLDLLTLIVAQNLSQSVITVKYSSFKNLATLEEQNGRKLAALTFLLKVN